MLWVNTNKQVNIRAPPLLAIASLYLVRSRPSFFMCVWVFFLKKQESIYVFHRCCHLTVYTGFAQVYKFPPSLPPSLPPPLSLPLLGHVTDIATYDR